MLLTTAANVSWMSCCGCAPTPRSASSLAWTLATPGALCQETLLLGPAGCERLTLTGDWPRCTIELAGRSDEIPDLLLLV